MAIKSEEWEIGNVVLKRIISPLIETLALNIIREVMPLVAEL